MQDIVDEKIVIVQIYSNIEMSGFKVLVVNIKMTFDNLLAIIMQIYFSLGKEMWMRFLDKKNYVENVETHQCDIFLL